MQIKTLNSSERLDGYDTASIHDLGYGDGCYFHLIRPQATADIVGVDTNPELAELGWQDGFYRNNPRNIGSAATIFPAG